METLTSCPFCTCSHLIEAHRILDSQYSKEWFTLVDCASCGIRFTNPRPTPSSIGRYYSSLEYLSHNAEGPGALALLYRIARRFSLVLKYRMIRAFAPDGNLLDFGCGSGDFLDHMHHWGYRVLGVEPSQRARKLAAHRGLTTLASLEELPSESSFRVITLWHVLEHLHDPRATLSALSKCLESGGLLVIAVPDRESADAEFYGAYWAAWDVPRHLWHFRKQDIRRLVESCGLTISSERRMWLDAYYISLLSERAKGRSTVAAWLMAITIGSYSNLKAWLFNGSASSSLLFARKP